MKGQKPSEKKEFVGKANIVHNNKYDYSKVVYIKSIIKVKIICPIHGEFEQRPDSHIRGCGCFLCGMKRVSEKNSSTKNEFIKKSILKHDNKYNYSKVDYKGNRINVDIQCKKHGIFKQSPSNHLKGQGCPKCKGERIRLSHVECINKFKNIHKNKYDYSKVVYTNQRTKVNIICTIHGEFFQTPVCHWNGKGCPKCKYDFLSKVNSKKENEFLNYINISKKDRSHYIEGYIVDGYFSKNKTIYEFLGDFWHGNPEKFNLNEINPVNKQTFKSLHVYTFNRLSYLKNKGYIVKYIWESDWDKFKKGIDKVPKISVL